MEETLAITQKRVNALLGDYFAQKVAAAAQIDARYVELWTIARDTVLAGGKRFRPHLIHAGYRSYAQDETPPDALWHVAAGYELLHASLLMHDDIIDRDFVRHGQPNVSGRYIERYQQSAPEQAQQYADGAALLAGDLLLSAAHSMHMQTDLSAEQKQLVASLIDEAVFVVAGGEFLDMDGAAQPQEPLDSLRVAETKTANYSFVVPLVLGAELAGAAPAELEKLRAFGMALGVAFQLVDDMLGVFGDTGKTGKSNLSDLREGKRTLLLQYTYERATETQRSYLDRWVGNVSLGVAEAAEVRSIMEESGGRAALQAYIGTRREEAMRQLHTLQISADRADELRSLVQLVVERAA